MTMTTRIRFTEPVDPRMVWMATRIAISAPVGYTWVHHAANSEPMHDPNPLWMADSGQGAGAWAIMRFGADGGRLVEEWEHSPQYADDYPADQRGPNAYVELELINGNRECHAIYVHNICRQLASTIVEQNEYTGKWCEWSIGNDV